MNTQFNLFPTSSQPIRKKVYAFRKNQSFKIYFWVTVKPSSSGNRPKGLEKAIRREARRLNKENKYYCREKMVMFTCDGCEFKL